MFRLALRFGSIAGFLMVVFAVLKSEWYFSGLHPEFFLSCLGLAFLFTGIYMKKQWDNLKNESDQQNLLSNIKTLSKREEEVLELLFTDLSNKEIAHQLHIEMSTLKSHINAIYRKLNIINRKELLDLYPSGLEFKSM